MDKIIIDIFLYVFAAILLWYYANTLFAPKHKTAVCLAFSLGIHAVLGVVYQFGIVYLNVGLLLITYALMFKLMYEVNWKTAVFHSAIFVAVMFASEIIVMAIGTVFFKDFNAMDNDIGAYLYVIVMSKLVYLAIILAIMKLFANKEKSGTSNRFYWILFILPLSSALVFLAFRYVAYNLLLTPVINVLWTVTSLLIVFANIIVFIIYEYSLKNASELYELKALKLQEEQDKKYYELIEQSNNDMRMLAHDMNNHFTQIRNMSDADAIHTYVDNLSLEIESFTKTGVSKNKMLDLIISKYMRICERKQIRFDVDAKTANLSYISDVDLSTLMNNLLDNAVEAAEKSSGREVSVSIFVRNEVYDGLIIRNSCDSEPSVKDGLLMTTKSNKSIHGVGITSVKKIIKKYNAVYDWKYDNNGKIFETDIAFIRQ